METSIVLALTFGFIIFCWIEMDTFACYLKFMSFCNFLYLGDYWNLKESKDEGVVPYPGNYADYLQEYHDNFFVKLITCPVCLSFWCNVAFIVISLSLYNPIPSVIVSCITYGVLNKLLV